MSILLLNYACRYPLERWSNADIWRVTVNPLYCLCVFYVSVSQSGPQGCFKGLQGVPSKKRGVIYFHYNSIQKNTMTELYDYFGQFSYTFYNKTSKSKNSYQMGKHVTKSFQIGLCVLNCVSLGVLDLRITALSCWNRFILICLLSIHACNYSFVKSIQSQHHLMIENLSKSKVFSSWMGHVIVSAKNKSQWTAIHLELFVNCSFARISCERRHTEK